MRRLVRAVRLLPVARFVPRWLLQSIYTGQRPKVTAHWARVHPKLQIYEKPISTPYSSPCWRVPSVRLVEALDTWLTPPSGEDPASRRAVHLHSDSPFRRSVLFRPYKRGPLDWAVSLVMFRDYGRGLLHAGLIRPASSKGPDAR